MTRIRTAIAAIATIVNCQCTTAGRVSRMSSEFRVCSAGS